MFSKYIKKNILSFQLQYIGNIVHISAPEIAIKNNKKLHIALCNYIFLNISLTIGLVCFNNQ